MNVYRGKQNITGCMFSKILFSNSNSRIGCPVCHSDLNCVLTAEMQPVRKEQIANFGIK